MGDEGKLVGGTNKTERKEGGENRKGRRKQRRSWKEGNEC